MKAANITQLMMAEAAGVTQGAVSGWLNGAVPKMDKITKIAAVLGLNPDYLLDPEKYRAPVRDAVKIAERVGGAQEDKVFNAAVVVLSERLTDQLAGSPRAKLRAAREAKGLSQAQLAKKVGYKDASVYQDIEEGRSQMGEKMAIKIAKVLGVDVEELTNGSDHPTDRDGMRGTFGAVPNIGLPPGMTAKYVPLLSMAQCGTMMAYDDGAYAHDGFLAFNPQDPKAFAVTLAGDSMVPRFEPGDVAVVYPSKPPKNGCVVIARLNEDNGGDVMLKLYQSSGENVTLSSYNPAYPAMQFHRSAFAWIYPVAQVTKELE